jgi:hypothetical protein
VLRALIVKTRDIFKHQEQLLVAQGIKEESEIQHLQLQVVLERKLNKMNRGVHFQKQE